MSKILFDIGSLCTKFNVIGQRPLMINTSTNCYIDFSKKGSTLEFYAKFPNCTVENPYGDGTFYSRCKIINKNKYSDFFGYCFRRLECDPSEQSVVVLTPPVHQKHFIENTTEILFETYNINSLSMAPQSLFASDHPNFVSVLFGFSDTYIVSHIECKVCHKSFQHIPVGGHQITEFISKSLMEKTANQNIDEDNIMWLAEHVKLIDRFAYFDSNIAIEDFKHSTPLKTSFRLNPLTLQKEYFTFGYERYLATAFTLFPDNIDPSIKYTLADKILDSIHEAIHETNSKSSIERKLKNKIAYVGGPASARGIKYKLKNAFKSKKSKKKATKKNHAKKGKDKDDASKDTKNENVIDDENKDSHKSDENDDDPKDEDNDNNDVKEEENNKNGDEEKNHTEDSYLTNPTTQIFRIASNFYEKTGGSFISKETYKEDGFDPMSSFYL